MTMADFVSKVEVQRACRELNIRDWTQPASPKVTEEEAQIIQAAVGAEAMQIPVKWYQQGLEVELEHGSQFPDANVTNNHPILTGKIVLAHLKETFDYYLRLNVVELEGDLLKASKKGDAEKLAQVYKKWVAARAELIEWEKSQISA